MSGALQRALRLHREAFGGPATLGARAPGRVNLIGEHTDYNDGFVCPVALDRACFAVASSAPAPRVLAIRSADAPDPARLDLSAPLTPDLPLPAWARYVAGVAAEFQERGVELPSLNIAFASDVPLGSGLSSSASLEVAAAALLADAAGVRIEQLELARLCQRAEHRFAGVPCGIMDQLASVCGRRGSAMRIDCRSLEVVHVPLPEDARLIVADSGVRHELASGAYAQRRRTCAAAADALGVRSLRDATTDSVERSDRLGDEQRRCARHVTAENARVLGFEAALRRGDLAAAGGLMNASHDSLRDDYRVSCAELDGLVEAARALPGVFGSRMTGGGFGGCTVTLCSRPVVGEVASALESVLRRRRAGGAGVFACSPAEGARPLDAAASGGSPAG